MDGNKRIGMYVMLTFLEVNGIRLDCANDEVVEVGPGGLVDGNEVKMEVAVGDKVLVGKYSGSKIKLDDVDYTIVRQSDILAIVE